MTNVFKKAFEDLIGIEGGYVDDPVDAGGETKYGISKRAFPSVDIKALTLEGAKKLYWKHYWEPLNLHKLNSSRIAIELFDTGVNMGVGTAGRFLQEALNLMNRNQRNFADLKVDAKIGPKTISAYKKVDKDVLLKVLNGLQFCRYRDIVVSRPSQERFFNGWMRRV